MMPAVVAYLDSPAYRQVQGAYKAADYQSGRVRWLCSALVVEVRPDDGRWRVGMDVACGDYDRRGSMMYLEGGGDEGEAVMVLSGGPRYQVVSAAVEPGVSVDPAWVSRHFSARAAAEINSSTPPEASRPDDSALRAFGCSTSVKGSYDHGAAEAWPCQPG